MNDKTGGKMENALIEVASSDVATVFQEGGLDPFIQSIRDEVTGIAYDVSKTSDRKLCRSSAHKVARSKTYLDGLGKTLVQGIKKQAAAVDAERKRMRDELDSLKDEVLSPVVEWEKKDAERVAEIEFRIDVIRAYESFHGVSVESFEEAINELTACEVGADFEEFQASALEAKSQSLGALRTGMERLIREEKLRAEQEAERQRLAIEAEKLRKEREQIELQLDAVRKEREAEERARLEREQAAALEAARKEMAAAEEQQRLQREAEKAKRQALEAKLSAERAVSEERERVARLERERAAELERIKAEKEAESQAEGHRDSVIKETATSIFVYLRPLITTEAAYDLAEAIALGDISNATLEF